MKKKALCYLLAALTVFGVVPFAAVPGVAATDYSQYNVTSYNAAIYTSPIWQGNVVVNECVYPIKAVDGSLQPFKLTYPATQIISVRNYQLTTTYVAGRDYTLNAAGELVILSGSSIPTYSYRYIHPNTNPNNYDWGVYYPHRIEEGIEYPGWEFWEESSKISMQQICVTYVHAGNSYITRPDAVGDALPRSMAKLTSGQPITIVTTGDSVTAGAQSSGFLGISPNAPAYPGMIKDGLAVKFNNPNITLINTGIGGTTSEWTESTLNNTIISKNPDLVTICFGMNDSSYNRVGYTDSQFYNNMKGQINYIKSHLPNCEILLVSSIYGNYYTFPRERYESHARILHELAAEYAGQGVAVCDPQAIEKQILTRKVFIDFMADNMVHPNDFGMRLITQTICDSLRYASVEESADVAISQLRAAVSPARGKDALYESMIAEIRAYFISLQNDFAINEALPAKKAELQDAMRYCADGYHAFETIRIAPKCGVAGKVSDICSYCGYEQNVTILPAISGSHTYGTAEITLTATAHNTGLSVKRCTKCGDSIETVIPATSSAVNHAFHNDFGYNYMQSNLYPYANGNATIIFDVIPIDVNERSNPSGPCYFGVWLGDSYTVLVGYDFTMQKFIVGGVGMTYPQSMTDIIAQADYPWKKMANGCYPMHRFAINVQGNNLKIYMDGTQVLSTSSSRIGASKTKNDLVLLYTKGEYCLDNFVVSKTSYNVATGSGSTLWTYDCESGMTKMSGWTFGGYTTVDVREYDTRNNFPENHVHSNTKIASHAANEYHGSYDEYECSVCFARTIVDTGDPAIVHSHTIAHAAAKAASCTEAGNTEYWYCTSCGRFFSDSTAQNEIDPASVVIPASGHDYFETIIPATCEHKGYVKYICSICGDTYTESEIPPALHNWGDWTVTTEPTCFSEGVETRVCANDATHIETRAIPATGNHFFENGVCTTPGCTAIDPDFIGPTTPHFAVSSATARAGQQVKLTVSVVNNPGIATAVLKLVYDKNVLTLTDAENGELFSDLTVGLRCVLDNYPDVTDDGVAMTLTFTVSPDAAAGQYTVKAVSNDISNAELEDVVINFAAGVVTVVDDEVVYGDVNGDGSVNTKDLIMLRKYISNLDDETGISIIDVADGADANADGTVSLKDLVLLRKYIADYDDESGTSSVVLGPQ